MKKNQKIKKTNLDTTPTPPLSELLLIGTVKVGPHPIKVYGCPEPLAEAGKMRGMFDSVRNAIFISEGMEGLAWKECFWHELTHAFWRVYGWTERMDEEDMVKCHSAAVVAFVEENAEFFVEHLL